MNCRTAVLIGAFAGVLLAGRSVESKHSPQEKVPGKPAVKVQPVSPAEIISVDSFFSSIVAEAQAVKDAPTAVARDEALSALMRQANQVLSGKDLHVVLTISDVRMKNAEIASLSVTGLETPVLNAGETVLKPRLNPTFDLPMTKEVALKLRPGQRLELQGRGSYHIGDMLSTAMMPNITAWVRYKGVNTTKQSVLRLQPKHYAILPASGAK